MNNTSESGVIDTDKFKRAMLQYRSIPDRDMKLSPAMCISGPPISDFIHIPPGTNHETWLSTSLAREEALRNRHMRCVEKLMEHAKRLPPLVVSDHVCLQNQIGPHSRKWDKTGVLIKVRQYDQYVICVDGSRCVTLCNRKCLSKYIPVQLPAHRLRLTMTLDFIGQPLYHLILSLLPNLTSPKTLVLLTWPLPLLCLHLLPLQHLLYPCMLRHPPMELTRIGLRWIRMQNAQ